MLSETFVTSIRAQQRTANTAIAKDIGIYVQTLHPAYGVKASFKKSSTPPHCTAVSSTHVFAAQADKAVVHVYSLERSNQEALISFPERIHSLTLVNDGVLALGTAEGRIILWEVCTGRQVSTPTAHLQAVSCITATSQHLITASDDSNIHVWSVASLLTLPSTADTYRPLRSLSNHRAPVTALAAGHSASEVNICVSASRDNTCIVWNYHTGDLLRTFLLPSTPLCLALDPCDRAVYVGFDNGSIQCINFLQPHAIINSLYDTSLQSTPTQVSSPPFSGAPPDIGSVHCLGISYDGAALVSGHASGHLIRWNTGRGAFGAVLADLNNPVTCVNMLSPFPPSFPVKAVTVVKPRLGEGRYGFTAQFTSSLSTSKFEEAVRGLGVPMDMLEAGILELVNPRAGVREMGTGKEGDESLKRENEELWKVVNEQRALQKRTYEKYLEAKTTL